MDGRRIHIFDLDQTLLDNKEAIEEAYRKAANDLNLPVPDFSVTWGRTAEEWGCPPQLHHRKTEIYFGMLNRQQIKPGWAAAAYTVALDDPQTMFVRVWTGASKETLTVLRSTGPDTAFFAATARAGMTLDDKRAAMNGIVHVCPTAEVHYYDDNPDDAFFITDGLPAVQIHVPLRGKPCFATR